MWLIWVGVAAAVWAALYVTWSVVGGVTMWLSDRRHMGAEQSPLRDYLREELRF